LSLVAVKLAVLGLLIVFASPTAIHALAKAALARGVDPLQTGGESSKR
jgi:multisubunit Na+/H+ antiporter MnhG subunit